MNDWLGPIATNTYTAQTGSKTLADAGTIVEDG
jgi:hypothetical protein